MSGARLTRCRKAGTGTVRLHGRIWEARAPQVGKSKGIGPLIGKADTQYQATRILETWLASRKEAP